MPWPFSSTSSSSDKPDEQKRGSLTKDSKSGSDILPAPDTPLTAAARDWAPVIVTGVGSLAAFVLYQSYLRRFPGASHVQENFFRRRTLFGKATSVGDGDGFHLYHTPGGRLAGWDWLRKVPESRADLKGKTISIRLAGVDAPEGPHFGRPGQPFAEDAQVFLSDIVLNRRVRARIYKRDQYNRIVATVFVRRFLFKKDVGLELLKKGLATTYEAKTGIEWGGREEVYKAAEAKAKSRKLGIWSVKASEFQSPRDYKAKVQGEDQSQEKKQRDQKSWWRKILGL